MTGRILKGIVTLSLTPCQRSSPLCIMWNLMNGQEMGDFQIAMCHPNNRHQVKIINAGMLADTRFHGLIDELKAAGKSATELILVITLHKTAFGCNHMATIGIIEIN